MENKILTIKDLNVSGTSVGFAEDSTYCPSATYFNNMVVDDEIDVVDVKFNYISTTEVEVTFNVPLPFNTYVMYKTVTSTGESITYRTL